MVLNKGLLEIGGYAVPSIIISNNKVEGREKAERSALLFGISFIAPFLLLPICNKGFLKLNKISDKFGGFDDKIMHLSKEYLTRDGKYLEKGINDLLQTFEGQNDYKEISNSFQNILKKFPNRELLRQQLIKTHTQVFLSDFISSALMMGGIYWGSNWITKQKTGKDGFSAKFEMVDERNLKKNAKEHEQSKFQKMAIAVGLILASGSGIASTLKKGMLSSKSSKFIDFVKKHASKFDYQKGVFMSRATLFGIMVFGDVPNTLLASRDKEELKYNTIKNAALLATFFGGDLLLNNSVARIIDGATGTKLIDESRLKEKNTLWNRITCPLKTFKEINENKINLDAKTRRKTKIAGVGMFWGNFIILCALMGFGLPYVLNKNLRKDVAKEK